MNIKEKILMDLSNLETNGPINIVAFGDSITYGAFNSGEKDFEAVYWNQLRNKLLAFRSDIPVNMINAGIGGTTAKKSLDRIERQVLTHVPDLIIVSFGLNDVNGTLEDYISSLSAIFEKCKGCGSEVIFMTPNMLNTYVAEDTDLSLRNYAAKTAEIQNSGKMDVFMESACKLASEMDVKVCDCYSLWKQKSKSEDTTMLLANRINHPIREMHKLFAENLYEIIFR